MKYIKFALAAIALISSSSAAKIRCGKGYGECPDNYCCSHDGYCGVTFSYCKVGCQKKYGSCYDKKKKILTRKTKKVTTSKAYFATSSPSEEPTPVSTTIVAEQTTQAPIVDFQKKISTNGKCGPEDGICPEGSCCSQWGWCGTTMSFCGTGCLEEYGKCGGEEEEQFTDDGKKISTTGQCGAGFGVCPDGGCCSQYGWCGLTMDYCGTGCIPEYGECGEEAINSRKIEGFSYYNSCVDEKYWALTFDDGPYQYEPELLDLLKKKGVKATFFLVGSSGTADIKSEYSKNIIQRMDAEGHIVASHTWSHQDLAYLKQSEVVEEITKLEDYIFRYINKKPAFVRPPYGTGNGKVELAKTLRSLGYSAAVTWNIDLQDYSNKGDIDYALEQYTNNLGHSALSLNHVVYEGITKEKLLNLVEAEIDFMLEHGYTPVTIDKCLGLEPYQPADI